LGKWTPDWSQKYIQEGNSRKELKHFLGGNQRGIRALGCREPKYRMAKMRGHGKKKKKDYIKSCLKRFRRRGLPVYKLFNPQLEPRIYNRGGVVGQNHQMGQQMQPGIKLGKKTL